VDPPSKAFSIGSSFNTAAQWTSRQCGRASTFAIACATILVWAVTGPMFHYSDTWQLVINTGTTIVTFLMVFLIQNTQNRDSAVLHLKLDELIRVSERARNTLLDLEGLTETELDRLKGNFARLAGTTPSKEVLNEVTSELNTASDEIEKAIERVHTISE
jgi:low affinity Fe/Cu permease